MKSAVTVSQQSTLFEVAWYRNGFRSLWWGRPNIAPALKQSGTVDTGNLQRRKHPTHERFRRMRPEIFFTQLSFVTMVIHLARLTSLQTLMVNNAMTNRCIITLLRGLRNSRV